MYLTEMQSGKEQPLWAVKTDMICRNCSAVVPDDCGRCPSCGKEPDKRGQSGKTAVVTVLIALVIFLSCTAIALKINRPDIFITAASTAAPTSAETTAFFAFEEKTGTEAQTQAEQTTEETAGTKEDTSAVSESIQSADYVLETVPVKDSSGNEQSKRAVIRADKEDFQRDGKNCFEKIRRTAAGESGYLWLTVTFDDSTGIVFFADSTFAASYGILDGKGLVSELFGVIIIGQDGSCSYFPVSKAANGEPETTDTQITEEAAEQSDESDTEAVFDTEEASQAETQTQVQTQSVSEKEETDGKAAENDNSGSAVYITATGKKFHRPGCASLSKSKIRIDRSEALNEGYEPCKRCNP